MAAPATSRSTRTDSAPPPTATRRGPAFNATPPTRARAAPSACPSSGMGLRRPVLQPLRRALSGPGGRGRREPDPPRSASGRLLARGEYRPTEGPSRRALLARRLGLSPRRDRDRRGRGRRHPGHLQEPRGGGTSRVPARARRPALRHAQRRPRDPGRTTHPRHGREAGGLLAPTDSRSNAVYLFEELALAGGLRLQAAGRIEGDRSTGTATLFPGDFLPVEGEDPLSFGKRRRFAPKSISFGALQELPYGFVASLNGSFVGGRPPRSNSIRGVRTTRPRPSRSAILT